MLPPVRFYGSILEPATSGVGAVCSIAKPQLAVKSRGQEQTSCLGPDATRFFGIPLIDQTEGMGAAGEFVAEEAGERGHAGAAGASLSLRVVIGVGVDVVSINSPVGMADELDPGDLDSVGGDKCFVAPPQPCLDVVDDGEFRARLFAHGTEG